ncbi:MAG: 50S ribosomal protein L30e [Candidatus Nezhaarchaeota archaeon]|nr:50S ribosomal protein L30e [Candidatus Nezhaarchaeota archaeon]MCX8141738.1 50S ribosomal protein L30e [Candidatus Nezhaarchaeota archaeon]MDW8050484.1 50S ribosomal protein L30e [Nitrososphaerota archaeon]
MLSLDRELKVALRTGSIVLGSKKVLSHLGVGKGKLVIMASNCPELVREKVEYYAKLSGIPIYHAPYTSRELGEICQRGHVVATLLILDEGSSEILKVLESG